MPPDLSDFWLNARYAEPEYVDTPFTAMDLTKVEAELGYKLPELYVALMRLQNGGMPKRAFFRLGTRGSSDEDAHIAIQGIKGVGWGRQSLCGEHGSRFWIESDWNYPAMGVYFADCPSGGHEMLCLDYRDCGPLGEPKVVAVSHAPGGVFPIEMLAENFEAFIYGLEAEDAFNFDE